MEDYKEKIDYNFINTYFSWIDQGIYGTTFGSNLNLVMMFLNEIIQIIEVSGLINNVDLNNGEELNIYLSLTDTLEIVSSYIEEKMPQYRNQFEIFMQNGVFDIKSYEGKNCYKAKNDAGRCNNHNYINISLMHNYHDPETIIHEFFHVLSEQETMSYAREYLTEGISIFFENSILDYMLEKGYNQDEITKAKLDRIKSSYVKCLSLSDKIIFIDTYMKFGCIDCDSWSLRKYFKFCCGYDDENEFYKTLYLDEKQFKSTEDLYDPVCDFSYIIGTALAYWGTEKSLYEKFIKLNQNINNHTTFTALNFLGIDDTVKSLNGLFDGFRTYLGKIKSKFKEK